MTARGKRAGRRRRGSERAQENLYDSTDQSSVSTCPSSSPRRKSFMSSKHSSINNCCQNEVSDSEDSLSMEDGSPKRSLCASSISFEVERTSPDYFSTDSISECKSPVRTRTLNSTATSNPKCNSNPTLNSNSVSDPNSN